MRPEPIIFITAAVITAGLAFRADKEDRPAALFCAFALLCNTVVSNLYWSIGIPNPGQIPDACTMITAIFAMFFWHRSWLVPLACLGVVTMIIRAVFEDVSISLIELHRYMIAAVNACFVLQLAVIVTATLSGGKRGGKFDVRGDRVSGDSNIRR